MTAIVESLFGVNPERYKEQQDAALQQEALAYAKLDPMERATAGIYAGARGLASGIGRMLGGEDPGMRRVTEQDQIIRSIDLNNPETFGPAAQRAYQMGHTELAQKILLGADTAYERQEATRKRAADIQLRQQTAEAQAMLPNLMREARPEQMVSTDDTGVVNTIPAQAAGIDPDIQRRLMGTAVGQTLLKSFAEITKAMQGEVVKYGEGDVGIRTNPFTGNVERVVTGEPKYRAPIILSPGQTAIPANDSRLTGTGVTAPAAAAKPPEKLEIMRALGYSMDAAGDAAYEAAKRAAPTVAAPPGDISTMTSLGIPITPGGYAYFQELKTKPPVVAPEARTQEDRNAEIIALGAGPKGSPEFNAALRAEVLRMTAKPAAVTAPESTTPQIKNATALARLKGEPGTPAFNKEFVKQMEKSSGGEGGAGGAAGTGTVEVVDPKDRTKTIIVTKARAVAEGLTPAKAIEGLTPQMRQKLEANYPQATSSLRSHQNKSTMFIRDLEALRDSPGLDSVTGFAAGRAPGLTDAGRAAVSLYDKVVAKGGFQSLQDLRDASKTGGALGNISNMEGKQLIASFAAIDRKQNAADVRKAINEAIDDIKSSNIRLQDAYDLTYEYKRGNTAPAAAGVDANNPLLRGK